MTKTINELSETNKRMWKKSITALSKVAYAKTVYELAWANFANRKKVREHKSTFLF